MARDAGKAFAKALTWRLAATTTTVLIAYYLTGNAEIAFSLGAIEVIAKTLLYYLHERLWEG